MRGAYRHDVLRCALHQIVGLPDRTHLHHVLRQPKGREQRQLKPALSKDCTEHCAK